MPRIQKSGLENISVCTCMSSMLLLSLCTVTVLAGCANPMLAQNLLDRFRSNVHKTRILSQSRCSKKIFNVLSQSLSWQKSHKLYSLFCLNRAVVPT